MSPIFFTIIFFTVVTLITHSVLQFIKRKKDLKRNLFLHLSKEGSANNLVFCSQEILYNKVMGIDGIHRKVMILEKINKRYESVIMSLDEMQSCELKKSYENVKGINVSMWGIEKTLSKIELQFGFKNNGHAASITFYDHIVNPRKEIVLLKAKAEYWRTMLSKMMVMQPEVTV